MITSTFLAVLCIAETALAAEHEPMLPTTTLPIVYTFGYTDQYFTDPQYIDRFRAAPPNLLQVGKAVPITHLWGPVCLYAGENQYTGNPGNTLNATNIALLTPEALAQRVEHIRDTLVRYHAIGIREITPYICLSTLAGDHEKRLGFWDFYDHWDRYAKWAGPRPERDPFDWLAVDREGKFLTIPYGYTPSYFAPLHRYRACINHPDWAEWQRRLMHMIAQVGYDGCFIDNSEPAPCYCRYCQRKFHEWLVESRSQGWVRRFTEGLVVDKLTLDSDQTPDELVRRWRLLGLNEHLGMLREAGCRVRPGFTIFPNAGVINDCLIVGDHCDRQMFESRPVAGLNCANEPNWNADASGQSCIDHVAELLLAQHMHARTIQLLDYRTIEKGEDRSAAAIFYLQYVAQNRLDNVQELALAETAAFSGGGGVASNGRPQATYSAFFKEHPGLFAGWRPTAPVAVLHAYWGPATFVIDKYFAASHRPFVSLIDASLPDQASELASFAALYLESPAYDMSPEQLRALRDYARHGCIVLGDQGVAINGRPAVELLGDSRVTIWDPKQPATPAAPVAPNDGIRKNIRFAFYRKADRLAIHAVNYNVCLLDPQKKVLEVEATPLRVPLPVGWEAAVATCFDPGAAPQALPVAIVNGIMQFTLPKIHIYKIVVLERQ